MLHRFEPVQIWEGTSMRRAIGDVERAAEWLLERWPPAFGDTEVHWAARQVCLDAWEGRAPAEVRIWKRRGVGALFVAGIAGSFVGAGVAWMWQGLIAKVMRLG
nr:DUF982 domain-containing protein [Kaistia adipata]